MKYALPRLQQAFTISELENSADKMKSAREQRVFGGKRFKIQESVHIAGRLFGPKTIDAGQNKTAASMTKVLL